MYAKVLNIKYFFLILAFIQPSCLALQKGNKIALPSISFRLNYGWCCRVQDLSVFSNDNPFVKMCITSKIDQCFIKVFAKMH